MTSTAASTMNLPLLAKNRFQIVQKVGSGSFGEIYKGVNVVTGQEVAIKLERVDSKHPQLLREAAIYRTLQNIVGIPFIHWDGTQGDKFNVMVVDLLGKTLEECLNESGRRLSLKTVLMLADQLLSRLEILHSKGFLHR